MKVKSVSVLSLAGIAISTAAASAGPVGVQRSLSPDQKTAALSQLQAGLHQDFVSSPCRYCEGTERNSKS